MDKKARSLPSAEVRIGRATAYLPIEKQANSTKGMLFQP